MKKSVMMVVLFGAVSIAAGAVLGIMMERGVISGRIPRLLTSSLPQSRPEVVEEERMERMADRMKTRLKLTSEQEAQLKIILEQARFEVHQAKTTFRDDLFKIRGEVITRLSTILTPTQELELREMLKEHNWIFRRQMRHFQ